MDETEKQIVEWRRSEVLSPARELEATKWEQWSDRRSAELWQVVALSLGCAPLHRPKLRVFVGVATTTPAPQQKASAAPRLPGDDLSSLITIELLDRLRINSDFVFRLEAATDHLGSTEAGERTKVSFQDFRRLADRLNWKLSEGFVSLAPYTSSGNEAPLTPTAATPLTTEGTVVKQNRSDPLIACITLAQREAADPKSWTSVWAALVQLARSKERPPPLLGYTEGEGIKYDAPDHPDGVLHLTKAALRMRFSRTKNAAARQRTAAHGSVT